MRAKGIKINLHIRLWNWRYHFYRRPVGSKMVFTIYRNNQSIWQKVTA